MTKPECYWHSYSTKQYTVDYTTSACDLTRQLLIF